MTSRAADDPPDDSSAGGDRPSGNAAAGRAASDLGRASVMIELGRHADAARLLSGVLAAEPDNCRAWCLLSRAHLGQGELAEAAIQAAPGLAPWIRPTTGRTGWPARP